MNTHEHMMIVQNAIDSLLAMEAEFYHQKHYEALQWLNAELTKLRQRAILESGKEIP